MKNIILVTHGELAIGILSSLKLIYGEVENIGTVTITASENMGEIKETIYKKIKEFNNDFPTIIITDITNGSTTQVGLSIMNERKNTYLISGVNLGLLLEVILGDFTHDENKNKELLREIVENAKETISFLNDEIEEIVISKDSDEL
jgi:mannose/fructose/sorbose-specific phosphotransferase system IIA component